MESYKGPLTKSKIKNLGSHQENQDLRSEFVNVDPMGDQE